MSLYNLGGDYIVGIIYANKINNISQNKPPLYIPNANELMEYFKKNKYICS